MAAGEPAVGALFHQAGVIRAGTLEEMFDVAAVVSSQPPPAGRRVAVLTNGGGPGILVPERAAAALGQVARWAEWRSRPAGHVVTPPGIDPRRGRALAGRVLGSRPGGGWADAAAAEELLAAYGIPTVASRRVRTPGEAAAAQAELGGPVAVKIAAAIHKSDVGGVALGIDSPQAAAGAVTAIRATLADAGIAEHAAEFLVQEQVRDGVEMIVGVSHDPAFGPLVMAGLGGTTVEVLGDVALRITPLSDADVDEMLRSLRSYRLLTGYRRSPPLDVVAFAELLHRVSARVEDIREIAELDLNPVFVREHGAVVADVRVRLTR